MKTCLLFLILIFVSVCGFAQRNDAAILVNVPTNTYTGSLQNGSWSPNNQNLLCTNWAGGYNQDPANIYTIDLSDFSMNALTTNGQSNCNMPGLTWNPVNNKVIFSADGIDGDQVYTMLSSGAPGSEVRITPFTDRVCWEPGFSPYGDWIVYEAHYNSSPANGIIEIYKTDGTQFPSQLTASNIDCRQPSWSPSGNKIVYQRLVNNIWDIWTMDSTGANKINITGADAGDKTDASFSPNGEWIVYSTNNGMLSFANVYIKNLATGQLIRVTNYAGYDGAPSWSTTNKIVFESTAGDPDFSTGAKLWIIDAPINGTLSTTVLENSKTEITVFPNPASDLTSVFFDKSQFNKNATLCIYNTFGQLLKKTDVRFEKENSVTLNFNGYKNGVYYLSISDDVQTKNCKLFIRNFD